MIAFLIRDSYKQLSYGQMNWRPSLTLARIFVLVSSCAPVTSGNEIIFCQTLGASPSKRATFSNSRTAWPSARYNFRGSSTRLYFRFFGKKRLELILAYRIINAKLPALYQVVNHGFQKKHPILLSFNLKRSSEIWITSTGLNREEIIRSVPYSATVHYEFLIIVRMKA